MNFLKPIIACFLAISLLIGCSSDSDSVDPDTSSSSTSDSESDATYNPDPIEVTACTSTSGIDKIICLADAFKAQLSESQLATVQRDYTITEAKKWSNLPNAERVGLTFGEMTTTQIQYAKAVLVEILSATDNEGWDEVQRHLDADEYLGENGGGSAYGAANFYFAFLGTPAETGTFEIQFGGHHLVVSNTYTDGVLVGATPSFRGIEPFAEFTWNGETSQVQEQERSALSAILESLSSDELATAKLSSSYGDIIAGPQEDDNFPATASGISCSELSTAQRTLVLDAIATYVDDIAEDDADAIMIEYTNELDDTYIAYSGTTSLETRNDYIRIDGPSVWIEYSVQNGVILQPTHPHAIWRDKDGDYGGN